MIKLAFDYQIFNAQKFGGISRYFFELANHLTEFQSEMMDCRIVSPMYINEYVRYSSSKLKVRGIWVSDNPKLRKIYTTLNEILSPITISCWCPNVIHETYYSVKSFAPSSSRIVLTVFDMIHELFPEFFSTQDLLKNHKKLAVQRADHIICISENTRKDLIRLFGVPPEKTTVIHLGFTLMKDEMTNLPDQTKPFILYVGLRGGYKNFERLLTAYSSRPELLKNYDLVTFGGGKLELQELKMIQGLNIPLKNIRHMDGDDTVLSALYRNAKMLVYPSLYEGFGIPPLEAMNFNCPVACSNTSSIPEVVGNAAVQFDPYDIDSIAAAMVMVSANTSFRNNLIALGRERVRQFSWQKCAMQTMDVYRSLLQ